MQIVIILNGAVSSGKTTIGKLLVDESKKQGDDSIFFDLDDFVEKRSPEFKWDTTDERLKDWLDARKELADITNQQLAKSKTIVVVGSFFTKEEIEGFTKYLTQNTKVYLYNLIVPLEERLKRNRLRKYSNPDEDIAAQQKEIDNITKKFGIEINNFRDQHQTVSNILEFAKDNIGLFRLL